MQDEERGKRLIAVFLLGVILFNFPILTAVETTVPLFVYLFLGWAGLIALLALIVERRGPR